MSATSATQPPQRLCPRCSTIARTADARCPWCGASYRRRSPLGGIAALLTGAVVVLLAGIALMLAAVGDAVDREIDRQVRSVQRDLDRDVGRLQDTLDERLPRVPGG